MSEDRLTQECYLWYHTTYPQYRGLLFHIPNGGARNSREGAKFKTMGVWRGVADFEFLWKGKAHFIEIKTGTGKMSKEQRYWAILVDKHGFSYLVARTLKIFQGIIKAIMSGY